MKRIIVMAVLVIALSGCAVPTTEEYPLDADAVMQADAIAMYTDCLGLNLYSEDFWGEFNLIDDEVTANCTLRYTEFARAHGYQGTT